MPELGKKALRRPRRRGTALIFTTVTIFTLMGVCSVVVDFGRVMTAKSELQRAADAAARAGAAALMPGSPLTPTNAAINMGAANKADAQQPVAILSSDVSLGFWDVTSTASDKFSTGGTTINAVRVSVSRTAAKGNAIPLWFAQVLGFRSCDVHVKATAMLHTATWTPAGLTTTEGKGIVSAKSNIFLAGQTNTRVLASDPIDARNEYNQTTLANQDPNINERHSHPWEYDISGTYGGVDPNTGQPYESPAQVLFKDENGNSIALVPGAQLMITNVSGTATNVNSYNGSPDYSADGSENGIPPGANHMYADVGATDKTAPGYSGESNTGTTKINGNSYNSITGSEHGIANIDAPLNSVVGVFLPDPTKTPDTDGVVTPAGYDFSSNNARDYKSLAPQSKQPFYMGNGKAGGSTQQSITIPSNGARLFVGTVDGQEWSNNQGGYSMSMAQYWISLVK